MGSKLLAYLDGELNPRERARVESHLTQCARCQEELARLKELRAGLKQTFHTATAPIHLSTAADNRIRQRLRQQAEQRLRWTFRPQWVFAVQAILAIVVLLFGIATYRALHPVTPDRQETIVLGQEKLAPGTRAALRVLVRSVEDGTPVSGARIRVQMQRAPGQAAMVFEGVTDSQGTAEVSFVVPEDMEGQAQLTIEARSDLGEDHIVRPITVHREYKLFVSSDKPIYQPGQTIHIRALALSAVDMKPAAGWEIEFIVVDPDGDKLIRRTVPASDFGIAALDFPLSPYAAQGRYTIQAVLGDTVSERTVTVQPYVLPKFRVNVETDRSFYRPGDRVSGHIKAEYFFGKPVASGRVTLRGYTYEVERVLTMELQGTTDDQGIFEFQFDLPSFFVGGAPEAGQAEFGLEVEVIDQANHRESVSRVLPVSEDLILIDAIPESGVLKPGVENIIFILTSYPDGRPADTTLRISVAGQEFRMDTGPYGLVEFHYVPSSGGALLSVEARDASGAWARKDIRLDAEASPETILLRAERAAYQVGETMRLEALTTATSGAVYLDIVREGQTISARSAPVQDGRAVFAVDLDETMFGTLELHAYRVLRNGTIVRDTRLVVVDMPRNVQIQVSSDADTYRPGETATLNFFTRTDEGPVQTALGLAIVDESVFALEEQAPGFARLYFLLERELLEPRYEVHGFSVPTLLDRETETEIRQQQDKAARASWAGIPTGGFSLNIRTWAEKWAQWVHQQQVAMATLGERLGWGLIALPIFLGLTVILGLHTSGVLGKAAARVAGAFAIFLVVSPFVAVVVGAVMAILWMVLETGALVLTLILWLGLLIALATYGWRERDTRLQLVAALLATYLVLLGLTIYVAERGGDPRPGLLTLIFIGFLATLFGLAMLGQGLILEGRRTCGWVTIALALLLVVLVIYLALTPWTSSRLVHTLGNPAVYAFPAGMLTGCAPRLPTPAIAPEAIQATPAPPPTATAATMVEEQVGKEAAPAERPRLRQYFPETLYWNPEAVTDEQGRLQLQIPMADSITTWRLTALASTRRGELGTVTYPIRVFQDFFVDLDLPVALTQGDEVSIPIAVYNYLPEEQAVLLELQPADWYTILPTEGEASYRATITIGPNDIEVVYFRIRAERFGRFSLQVTAWGERMSDAIAREVTILPDGTEQRTSVSAWLRSDHVTIQATVPGEAIPGTARVEVKVYPGPAAQLVDGLEGLLRMPSGCFEQTSSATYPNVLILDYLVRSGQATPEVEMTAERYIATGYQRLLTFEVPGVPGGFSLFGDPPPSLMHTAYGLMEFSDMARVYPVDPALIDRTARWLMSQQAGDGSWDPGYGGVHFESWQRLANARLPITAYVAWALVEAGYEREPAVQRALQYLVMHAHEADDPYVLALMVNSLAASDEFYNQAAALVDRLEKAAVIEDDAAHWVSNIESFTGAQGETAGLETTALATYALMRANGNPNLIQRGLNYLVGAKDAFGTWQTTQATVLALKAFVLSLEKGSEKPVSGTVQVILNGGAPRNIALRPEEAGVVHTVYFDDVPVGENWVTLRVSGGETRGILYQVTTSYYVPWEKAPLSAEPIDIRVTYDRTELAVHETVNAHVEIALNQPVAAQWVIVDLGVPPGFEVVTEDLDHLVSQPSEGQTRIKRYELTGRQIILYLENLSDSLAFDYRLRARFPLRAKAPAATVYDYYNPALRATQAPTLLIVEGNTSPGG